MARFDHLSGRRRAGLVRRLAPVVAVLALALPATVLAALPADVAVVAAKPVKRQVFDHWMFVIVKSASNPGEPAIVPTDPPRFSHCVAQVRAQIPTLRHTPTQTLRSDCAVLFRGTSRDVLDFLIRADWQDAQAAADGIVVTAAQVERAYEVGKRRNYPNPALFRRYLRRTGQTVADVKFRVRANLIRQALLKTEHLTPASLDAELTSRFKAQTVCARLYVMSDCAGG